MHSTLAEWLALPSRNLKSSGEMTNYVKYFSNKDLQNCTKLYKIKSRCDRLWNQNYHIQSFDCEKLTHILKQPCYRLNVPSSSPQFLCWILITNLILGSKSFEATLVLSSTSLKNALSAFVKDSLRSSLVLQSVHQEAGLHRYFTSIWILDYPASRRVRN